MYKIALHTVYTLACGIVLILSINLQYNARRFNEVGLVSCAAAGYFTISNRSEYHVKGGDYLTSQQMKQLNIEEQAELSYYDNDNKISRIILVTNSIQRLLLDTIDGYTIMASSAGFPLGNIYVFLIGDIEIEKVRLITELLQQQYSVNIIITPKAEYISREERPYRYTLLVNNKGRILYSSMEISPCSLRDYIDTYWIG